MTQHKHGEGSIYQRSSDGRWVAVISIRGRRLSRYADREAAVRDKLRALIEARDLETLPNPATTALAHWADLWLALLTRDHRRALIGMHRASLEPILQRIGTVALARLTPALLGRTLMAIFLDPQERGAVDDAYLALHACLAQAARLGLLASSPLPRIRAPRLLPHDNLTWSFDATRRFVSMCATAGGRCGPLWLFLLATGLRLQTCLALRWTDVDLEHHVLVLPPPAGAIGRGAPRQGARRRLPLPGLAVAALQLRVPPADPQAQVFVDRDARPPRPHELVADLAAICADAGVPRVTPNTLRDMHVSRLVAAGLDILQF